MSDNCPGDKSAATKWCWNCKQVLPVSAFSFANKATGTRNSKCMACNRALNKIWRDSHKEHVAETARKRYAEDPLKTRERVDRWRANNLEKYKAQQRRSKRFAAPQKKALYQANRLRYIDQSRRASRDLSRSYVAHVIGLPVALCPDWLIELKQEQLRIYRLARKLRKEERNESVPDSG